MLSRQKPLLNRAGLNRVAAAVLRRTAQLLTLKSNWLYGYIFGLYRSSIGVILGYILGLYWDNGK